jgi:hypothetical protein
VRRITASESETQSVDGPECVSTSRWPRPPTTDSRLIRWIRKNMKRVQSNYTEPVTIHSVAPTSSYPSTAPSTDVSTPYRAPLLQLVYLPLLRTMEFPPRSAP